MVHVFRLRGYHPILLNFPDDSAKHFPLNARPYNPEEKFFGLGYSRFARRYLGNLF
jgi:hypothetical protein